MSRSSRLRHLCHVRSTRRGSRIFDDCRSPQEVLVRPGRPQAICEMRPVQHWSKPNPTVPADQVDRKPHVRSYNRVERASPKWMNRKTNQNASSIDPCRLCSVEAINGSNITSLGSARRPLILRSCMTDTYLTRRVLSRTCSSNEFRWAESRIPGSFRRSLSKESSSEFNCQYRSLSCGLMWSPCSCC